MPVGLWSNCKGSLAGDIALGSTAAVTYVIGTRSGGDEATDLTQPLLEKSTTPKAFMRVIASLSSPCLATSGSCITWPDSIHMAVRGVTEKIDATFVTSMKKTDIDIGKDEGLILSVNEHMLEYRRPWKLVTLAIGIGLLIIGSRIYSAPDWDIPVSIIMASFTYLTAGWSMHVIIERRWRDWPVMLLLTWRRLPALSSGLD